MSKHIAAHRANGSWFTEIVHTVVLVWMLWKNKQDNDNGDDDDDDDDV